MSEIKYDNVVDGELFKFDTVGVSLEGVLLSYNFRKDTGKGVGNIYEVKTKNGVAAFFAPSLLHKKLSGIPLGSVVKITYDKLSKTANGNSLKQFTVGHTAATDAVLNALGISIVPKDTIGEGL